MFARRITDITHRTIGSDVLFFRLGHLDGSFLLKQFVIGQHFVQLGVAQRDVLDDFVAVVVRVVAVIAGLESYPVLKF